MWVNTRAFRRVSVVGVVWLLVVGAVAVLPGQGVSAQSDEDPGQAERPGWVDELEDRIANPGEVPEAPPWVDSTELSAPPMAETERLELREFVFPEAGSWEVSLRGEGERATVADGAAGPVEVAAGVDGVAGERLGVEVLDRSVAERLGVSGFVFEVADTAGSGDGGLLSESAEIDGLSAELAVDYSGFEYAYGGGYASRLQVVALPDCVLEDPVPGECDTAGQRLPTRVDREAGELVVEVDDLAGLAAEGVEPVEVPEELEHLAGSSSSDGEGEPASVDGGSGPGVSGFVAGLGSGGSGVVFGVMSATSGEDGSWAASPLGLSGSWQVTPGSGEFSWSYPFDLPVSSVGGTPEVGMAYSSGAVDGLTNATNPQASQAGLGWAEFGNAYIERSYEPCLAAGVVEVPDLCWQGHNATISLEGTSGKMLPLDAGFTEWAVRSDAGWEVERLTGADNGDDDGEHWKVTAPDGTQYSFGLGENTVGTATESAWTVPVWADHSGEPCRGAGDTFNGCAQAWRWNLDRIVDPDGNVTTFRYQQEENWFRQIGGIVSDGEYVRGGRLQSITYGRQDADSTPAVTVQFGSVPRCDTFNFPTCESTPANESNGNRFPDVPNDMICDGEEEEFNCSVLGPSFFSTYRYRSVRADVWHDGAWRQVTRYVLGHGFRTNSDGESKLSLHGVQRVGLWLSGEANYPAVSFLYDEYPNRVDVNPSLGKDPMGHHRLSLVVNEYGGLLGVEYGQNRPCESTYNPSSWAENTTDCFPQEHVDEAPGGGTTLRTGVFNKYLTTEVGEEPGDGSPRIDTFYEYGFDQDDDGEPDEGDDLYPAWAFNQGAFAQGNGRSGWSLWRGYGTTTITQGTSESRVRVFRGMDGDPLWLDCGGGPQVCGERDVEVETFDGPESFDDHLGLAGRTLEEQQIGTVDGTPDSVVQSTLYEYEHRTTFEGDQALGVNFDAEWAGVSATTESVATAPGVFRKRGGTTTYTGTEGDGLPPRPATSVEEGWLGETGDERCSTTTYAEDQTAWMLTYAASNVVREGEGCTNGAELSVTETYYDGSTTLGDVGAQGRPTLQRVKLDGSTWAETETLFDTYGRPVEVTDPEGATATTSYTASPANAIPTESTVTNDLGHTATTVWVPEIQAPRSEEDPNGNVTSYGYDAFGRVVAVRLPTEQPVSSGEPSLRFSYLVDSTKAEPPVVRTRQLTSEDTSGPGAVWEESWTVYDRSLRLRQSHGLSPEAGKVLVTETSYDNRGMAQDQTAPQAVTGTPGDGLLGVSTWDNRTRTLYDELGRPASEEWWRDSGPVHATSYEYGDDMVTVTGPDGAKVRETVDGLGRTVEVAEHDGTDWVASDYTYDLAGNLTEATDSEGNTIEYGYNLAGWKVTQDDPNRGTASLGYDLGGRQTSVTDALSNQVHTIYDPLGRPTERRANNPTGTLLASWDYDEPGELGLLHSETTHTSGGDWVSEVTGYDERSRSLGSTLTVPAGIPGLSGSYTIQNGYDRADRVTGIGLPAVGGLAQEWLTIKHDTLGLRYELDGLERYVFEFYDDRGRPEGMSLGHPPGGDPWMAKDWSYDADQRVESVDAWVDGSPQPGGVVSRHDLAYDEVGNLEEKNVFLNGSSWRECYGFDERQRLTDAHTVTSTSDCDTGTPGTGDSGFEHSYTYSADGRLTERTDGSSTYTYGYPTSGGTRPHAPTSVNSDTYTWDANGNLTERTVDGDTETFDWDIQQQLESVDGPDGETSFVYDSGGQRLLRQTDDGATLYFAGHEVTANSDGSQVEAVRSYSFNGQLVATRTSDGVDYLLTDEAGSVEMAVPDQSTPITARAYDPYGSVRVESGDPLATDKGFVGQIEDSTTNLSYLNARYYDPSIGVFISTDPIYDTASIKTLNPYTYASGNPASFADPSGTSRSYTWGVERQNQTLRDQNAELRKYIKRLGNQIEDLQRIIRKQNREMQKMLTHIRALEATIRQQASIIDRLVDKVNELAAQVAYWRNQAAYWYGRAQYWKGQAQYWKGQAMYWKGEAIKWRTTAYYWGLELVEKRREVASLRASLDDWESIGIPLPPGVAGPPAPATPSAIRQRLESQAETIRLKQDAIQAVSDTSARLVQDKIDLIQHLDFYMDAYHKGYGLKEAGCDLVPLAFCGAIESEGKQMQGGDPRDRCRAGYEFDHASFECLSQ